MAALDAPAWHPLHDNHAIEVMAIALSFAQPLPHRLLKKALSASEEAAFAAGLRSRQAIQPLQFTFDSSGSLVTKPGVSGQMFSSVLSTPEEENVSARIAEQLRVDQASIVYQTWQYVSWTSQSSRIRDLLKPCLDVVMDAVALATLRMEYVDRFKSEGVAREADLKKLLRLDSPLIAAHVFDAPDLWHSHTGAFIYANETFKRLEVINIDAVDEPTSSQQDAPKRRWVNITTALEDRFEGVESQEIVLDEILTRLSEMHALLKEILGSIITDDLSNRIYLKGT